LSLQRVLATYSSRQLPRIRLPLISFAPAETWIAVLFGLQVTALLRALQAPY